jgi:hypothetical protein
VTDWPFELMALTDGEGVFGYKMVVHGNKVTQLTVHGRKVLTRCSSWKQNVFPQINKAF